MVKKKHVNKYILFHSYQTPGTIVLNTTAPFCFLYCIVFYFILPSYLLIDKAINIFRSAATRRPAPSCSRGRPRRPQTATASSRSTTCFSGRMCRTTTTTATATTAPSHALCSVGWRRTLDTNSRWVFIFFIFLFFYSEQYFIFGSSNDGKIWVKYVVFWTSKRCSRGEHQIQVPGGCFC